MKITVLTPFPVTEKITGGQIYDNKVFDILSHETDNRLSIVSLETSRAKKNPVLAPVEYLKGALKLKDTDIFITNSAFYMRFFLLPFFLKRKRKKFITIHHHFMYRQFTGLKRIIYKYFEWAFLSQASNIVVASPYVYDELKAHYPEKKLLFNKIPFTITRKYPIMPERGRLTFTGTIEPRKGLHHLIESLRILKERNLHYPLTIIGKSIDEEYNKDIISKIKKYDLNVTFAGFISKDEVDRILSTTDVFVFPSLLEGYGMALIEAQVYGLPIVTFDNSAMPYNVKNNINGYTVPTGDEQQFATAIEKIVEDRALRQRLSEGALDNLKNQNSEENFKETVRQSFRRLFPSL